MDREEVDDRFWCMLRVMLVLMLLQAAEARCSNKLC
jgi:hypothetical protein